MSDTPMFSSAGIKVLAAAVRASYEKNGGMTPEFQADVHVATAKLAVETAREFTNRRGDQLALRLDALERKINERDVNERNAQLTRHAEHLQRLQTKVDALERFKADRT